MLECLFGECHSSSAALGQQRPEVTKLPLVRDWLAIPETLMMLNHHRTEVSHLYFRLYVSFPLDGYSFALPLLRHSGTGQHAASVAPFMEPDSPFTPLWWTFAVLRCRDLAGSSLAKSFYCILFTPARISLCNLSDDGLTSSVFQPITHQ